MSAAPPRLIFVIDDDADVRDSIKALLEACHYAVREFSSGRDFLRCRQGSAADCLVLDIHMPHMTGIDVLREIRKAGDQTPVLLITGCGDALTHAQAKALGAPVLDKPVPYAAFLSAIEIAIAGTQPVVGRR